MFTVIAYTEYPQSIQDTKKVADFATIAFLFFAIEIVGYSWRSTSDNIPGLKSKIPTPETDKKRKYLFRDEFRK